MLRWSKNNFLFFYILVSSFCSFYDEATHSYTQLTVPKYAVGVSNAVAHGVTTGVLQKTTEPEQYSCPVFYAPSKLTHIDEVL